jgi:type VI secretion system secreted protein Hcp
VVPAVLVAALFIMTGVVFGGAVDYFLKVDDVKGDSMDAKHRDEIDIMSWSWGVSQPSATRSAAGAGKVQSREVNFTAKVNSASVNFFQALATRRLFKQALLTCRKTGKVQQEFYKLTFKNVLVSSFQTMGSASSAEIPVDNFTFTYESVNIWYAPQRADGTSGPSLSTTVGN